MCPNQHSSKKFMESVIRMAGEFQIDKLIAVVDEPTPSLPLPNKRITFTKLYSLTFPDYLIGSCSTKKTSGLIFLLSANVTGEPFDPLTFWTKTVAGWLQLAVCFEKILPDQSGVVVFRTSTFSFAFSQHYFHGWAVIFCAMDFEDLLALNNERWTKTNYM